MRRDHQCHHLASAHWAIWTVSKVIYASLLMAVFASKSGYAAKALDQGLLINVTQGNIIRMLPPLTMTDAEADELVSRVVDLIKN